VDLCETHDKKLRSHNLLVSSNVVSSLFVLLPILPYRVSSVPWPILVSQKADSVDFCKRAGKKDRAHHSII
jgi:hypothetical protein